MSTSAYLLTFLLAISSSQALPSKNSSICDGFEANFDMKGVVGPWYVVAIIPGKMFPDKHLTCYKVEFSETDEAGLRWLVNRTVDSHKNLTQQIKGPIVRQRYHSEHPFDVWSKAVGVNGCFQLVVSLDTDNSDITKALTQETPMQLHILDTEDGTGSFLIQMLWGKMINAVVYRKQRDATQDQLRPAFEFVSKLRGPQRLPKVCQKYVIPLEPMFLD